MAVFIPVIYMLGGMALRATTATMAKRLIAAKAKKLAGKTTKKVVEATKANIDKAKKAAEKVKPLPKSEKSLLSIGNKNYKSPKPRIEITVKKGPKPVDKPKADKPVSTSKTKVKPTTKPKTTTPKKATTTQKTTGPNKPTVNKTTTKPKTSKPTTQPKSTKPVKKPSTLARNTVIVTGLGGAGYILDKIVNKDKPIKVDKTIDRPKREYTPITPKGPPQRTATTKKVKSKPDIPKDTEAMLSKIAAPKPKSNLSKFGRAFKNARKQGRYSFNYNGREVTTRFKEETVAEHKKKFGKK